MADAIVSERKKRLELIDVAGEDEKCAGSLDSRLQRHRPLRVRWNDNHLGDRWIGLEERPNSTKERLGRMAEDNAHRVPTMPRVSHGDPPSEPFEEPDPFHNVPFFSDLARVIGTQGPVSWDAARQLAMSLATNGRPESNVEPVQRMRLEELLRVAELRVADATGLSTSITGQSLSAAPVNRSQWIAGSLDAYRPLFEDMARALGQTRAASREAPGAAGGDAVNQWIDSVMKLLSPMMLGMTAGSMLGHLARRSLGQYDLPLPRPPSDQLLFAVPNIVGYAREWSLREEDVLLWVCVHEVTHHAVLGLPHVRERLLSLLRSYAAGFEADPRALEHRLSELAIANPADMAEVQRVLGDPEVLLGALQSPTQRKLLPQLATLVTAIEGYADHVMDLVGRTLLASYDQLSESLRRRRIVPDPSDRFIERLLGLELTREQYDSGARFIAGVLERVGPDALDQLWQSPRGLPTPAELDAPGLWLARLELPE